MMNDGCCGCGPDEDMRTVDLLSMNLDNGTAVATKSFVPQAAPVFEEVLNTSLSSYSLNQPIVASSVVKTLATASEVYQLNFDVEHVGKNKPQNKRVASWKYCMSRCSPADGFVASGSPLTSTLGVVDHEVNLTWSTHSGKYTISVDGVEVSSAVAKGSVLEHRWKWSHSKSCIVEDDIVDNDGDVIAMRVIACRKPPTRSSKNFRCYEFVIGGKVFRHLPVYSSAGSYRKAWEEIQNEESADDDGKLMSILDIIEPGWRASGFA